MRTQIGKRLMAMLLVLGMILSFLPVALAYGETYYVGPDGDDQDPGSSAQPFASIQKAYDEIDGAGTIILTGDLALYEGDTLRFDEDKAVTIQGGGATVTYVDSTPISNQRGGILAVTDGNVTLEDITIQMPDGRGTNGRPLYIGGGTVTLEYGAVIQNGYLAYSAGGVLVDGGTLTMEDGSAIRDNYVANNTDAYGGGVFVQAGAFVMNGGSVFGNTIHTTQSSHDSYGGGVGVGAGATFEMYGGSISGNTVDTAGGLYVDQDATVVFSGSLSITGNTATGTGERVVSNLYLPTDRSSVSVSGSMSGSIGVTHGQAEYFRIVGIPGGYTIKRSDEAPFFYDTGEYDIRLKEGNLILYWFTVGVDLDGDNIKSTDPNDETERGKDYETKLEPDEGYQLPPEITVTIDGEELDEDKYTYNPDTGEIVIPGEEVTGDIVIHADGNKEHTIKLERENVTTDSKDTIIVVKEDKTVIIITPNDRYGMPDDVTVEGSCTWDYDDGTLTIEDVTGDITVKISGSEIPHKIHFDPNEGTCDTTEVTINESQLLIGTLPVPTRVGYTFTGWFTGGGTRVTEQSENNMKEDLYLTARWSEDTNIKYVVEHYVEYVDSGSNPGYESGVTPTTTMEYGGVSKLYYLYTAITYNNGKSDSTITINHLLLGSMEGLNINGLTPNGGNSYTVTMQPDGSSVYPFFYDRNGYVVTFDPNGDGATIAAEDIYMDVTFGSIYGQLPNASRPGYSLIGWFTGATGGVQVKIDDVYTTAGDQTLYAHWSPTGTTKYQVVHMAQKIQDNLVSDDKSTGYEVYTFENLTGTADTTVDVYSIAIDGFVPSEDNRYNTYINADDAENMTVHYLFYDRIEVEVTYDANGGSEVSVKGIVYYGGTVTLLPATKRVGHDFTGWYTGIGEDSKKVEYNTPINSINPDIKTAITLYAHWSARSYELSFDTHGGILSGGKTVTYGQPAGEMPTASLKGYRFLGWYTEDTFLGEPKGIEITEETIISEENVIVVDEETGAETTKTLYAHYEPIQVTITFDPNGGTLPGGNTKVVTYDDYIGELPVPVLPGHTFDGWVLEFGAERELDVLLDKDDICDLLENVTVTARWVPNVYKITLDVNGGNRLDPDYITVTYDKTFEGLPIPSRTNYSFDGWFTEKSGGSEVTNGMKVTILEPMTLYAHWTYTGGGGDGGGGGGGGTNPPKTYTIEADAGAGASITPEGKTSVTAGGSQAYAMEAENGNFIYDVLVDGESVGRKSSYEFKNVQQNHTITVEAKRLFTQEHLAYIIGRDDGLVHPQDDITRAEVAMIFFRLLSDEARSSYRTTGNSFGDVASDAWYNEAVSTLTSMGILEGYSSGRFGPGDNITRAEFAAIAARFDFSGHETEENYFTDISGHWAEGYITKAASNGWVKGYEDGSYQPDASITRAEAMSLINRVLDRDPACQAAFAENANWWPDNMDPDKWYYGAVQEATNSH